MFIDVQRSPGFSIGAEEDARMNAEGCVSRGGSVLENSVGAKRERKFRGCRLAGSSEG